MANPSFLDLKSFVASQLGNVDQGTYVAKRESLINIARKKFYSDSQWTFLRVQGASVTITAQLGTLPLDYNLRFSPIEVYTYSGNLKYEYMQVDWSDLSQYQNDMFVYAIDRVNRQIKVNQTSVGSISMDYTKIPADRPADTSEDALLEPAPQITAIGYLAISMWWLSKERSTAKFQLFDDKYKEERDLMLKSDQADRPPTFFVPFRPYINKGYQSVSNG